MPFHICADEIRMAIGFLPMLLPVAIPVAYHWIKGKIK